MLRRFFVFFFLLSFLVCFLAFPVFAASYHYSISYIDGEGYFALVDSIPTSASVSYNISLSFEDYPGVSFTTSGVGVLTKIEVQPGAFTYSLAFTFVEEPIPLVLTLASMGTEAVVFIDSADFSLDPGLVFDVSLSTVEHPAFEESTSTGLSSAISWVKTVTDSLISGDLVDLLSIGAIAISISLLLLTAKIIRKFSWGS